MFSLTETMDSTQSTDHYQERKQPSFLTNAFACSMFNARQSPCRSLTAFKRTCHRYQKCHRLVGATVFIASNIQSIGRGPMFPENLFDKETRVSSISNHRLSVPLTPQRYRILLVSPVLFKELRPHSIRFNYFNHMAVCPCFFSGSVQCSQRQFPYTDAVAGGLRVVQCVYGISRIAVCLAWVPGPTWFTDFTTTSKLVSSLIPNTEAQAP